MDINYIAPINSLGYGVAGLNLLKALSKNNEVSYFPLGEPTLDSQADFEIVKHSIKLASMPNFKAPCVRVWHQHDMSKFVGGGIHAGFPIFELDTFTDLEKHHLGGLDSVLVCSEWAKDVVCGNIKNSNTNVVPLGVDRATFKETPLSKGSTKFFNCGKWEVRKGHDVLVEAFNKAFTEEDDVELWMMCHNPFYTDAENKEWESLYTSSKLGSKVKIIPRQKTHRDVYNIMSKVDCGVFPSRAEGWNLELLEMMSCGRHVIATDYSAHTEFCNAENSRLIKVSEKEKAFDGKWFKGQGMWAKLDNNSEEDLINSMKTIHNLKSSSMLNINKEGVKTAIDFSWDNCAEKCVEAIRT
tara:strand:+ start:128 stop:1192 length:1065 start_codon:yes stop_codon:yes gene_type:complete